jgi:hypothetical protein
MVTSAHSFLSPTPDGDAGHDRAAGGRTPSGSAPGPARMFPGSRDAPRYCPMMAVDITAFSDLRRGDDAQRFLRAAMYQLLIQAFSDSGLSWSACHHEDRGDGVLVVAPPGAPATALLDPFIDHLQAGLRRHNKFCNDLAKIRLRMSVHAGQVYFDENGVSGQAVTHLFRMLEADAFKDALAESGSDFALVASETLYEEVISHGPGLIDPGMYAPIDIKRKETFARAWLYLPPVRHPFLVRVANAGPRRPPAATGTRRRTHLHSLGASTGRVLPIPLPRPQASAASAASAVQGASAKDNVAERARLIASKAASMPGWLAGIPSSSVQSRFRARLHPGQHLDHG